MAKMEIGCYCGKQLETDMDASHDFMLYGEDSLKHEIVNCPDCGAQFEY